MLNISMSCDAKVCVTSTNIVTSYSFKYNEVLTYHYVHLVDIVIQNLKDRNIFQQTVL